jgi:hypothetical protein
VQHRWQSCSCGQAHCKHDWFNFSWHTSTCDVTRRQFSNLGIVYEYSLLVFALTRLFMLFLEQFGQSCQCLDPLQELALYLEYRLDESYTPKQISIRAGNSFRDMTEIHAQELDEPSGWTRIQLQTQNSLQGVAFIPNLCSLNALAWHRVPCFHAHVDKFLRIPDSTFV